MFEMEDGQFQLVYNILSFSLASMMSTTLFLWMRAPCVANRYQSAVIISGLVTFIAAYHYMRIFNSFEAAYTSCYRSTTGEINYNKCDADAYGYSPTGIAFNDAYRCMFYTLTSR